MAYTQYRSPFGDTTYTKVFVGGLAWETPTEEMRKYFEQFGEILEAVIITDKSTGKSKGYGFVTFRDPESARRACADPNPVIDGRRANCNIASFGRPRPSPPRAGRNVVPMSGSYQVGTGQVGPSYSGGVPAPLPPPLPPPPPPFVYPPPYGYQTYAPDYGYQQATLYNPQIQQPQYYPQMYGTSSSMASSPYYYGYTLQAPRGTFSTPQGHHRLAGPSSYVYYPAPLEGSSFSTYPLHLHSPTSRFPFPSTVTDSENPQRTSMGPETGVVTSESSNP